MMGLGALLRSTQYVATNTVAGESATFVVDNGGPDWARGQYRGAMSLPGAWRASLLISELLGSLPWSVLREVDGRDVRVATPPLLTQPAPPESRVATFASLVLDLVWHGNAIAVVASRGPDGSATSLVPVPADLVGVRRANASDYDLPRGELIYEIGTRRFSPADVVHVKGPCEPGAVRGMSVLENHLHRTFDLAARLDEQARSVDTAAVPSGVLKSTDPEFDEADARAAAAGWKANQRTRTLQVINASMEYTAVAWNPKDAQLLEARKFSLHDTALIFGLSPSWLGVSSGESMTYSTLESEATNLVRFSLAGHIARLEQALTPHLPPGDQARLNLDGLLRADTTSRYAAHRAALDGGFMSVNEVRALEDLPPVEGGNVLTPATRRTTTPGTDPGQED